MVDFSRQPRDLPEFQTGFLDVESPPSISEKPEFSWFSILIMPIVTISITIFVFLAGKSMGGFMDNPIFLIGTVSASVLSIVGALVNYNHQANKYSGMKKKREKSYRAYIKQTEAELDLAVKQQTEALRKQFPSPADCVSRMNGQDARLWERTPSFDDFLSLRLGIGTTKAALRVADVRQPGVMETDPLAGEPKRLERKYDKIQDAPVYLDLRKSQVCGVAGEKAAVMEVINNMLIQLAAHHGYDDIRFIIAANETGIQKWSWVRFLPHNWNDDFTTRFLICGKDMAGGVLSELLAVFAEREKKADDGFTGVHYVFIVEDPSVFEDSRIRKYVYEPNIKIGIAAVFAAEHTSMLPSDCGAIVSLKGKTAELVDRVSKDRSIFVPDNTEYSKLEIGARKISKLRIKANVSSYALPKSITLTKMLTLCGASQSEDFDTVDVSDNWKRNRTYNGMSVPIGAKVGSEIFYLDLHETGHGPHGLVAGTTGSGKSELLQTIIVSLALNFHPHDVNFVLIDYKGGGMADVFKGMPHLAGVITNLGGSQTNRALLSIKGEILRRQAVFAQFGVNNIDKYQRLYYRGEHPEMPPITHLIMIADEFAELKQDQPDFMKELVSAARVGRSLGIHLILATQKPGGVVDDQIWSNSKFKLCLKVQTEGDSNEVLKKPDSAFIKEPGRAYLQVGNNEIYELFQSAYSGADYIPADAKVVKADDKKVFSLSLDGKPSQIYPQAGMERRDTDKKYPSQLEVMVKKIIEASEKDGVIPLEGPWTPPLEETVYLNEVDGFAAKTEGSYLTARAGIVDDPRGQRKFPLDIDFFNEGNLLIFGAPGNGKTVFLKTLALSLCLRYSPDEVNLYVLDMSGASFKVFAKAPHCGGVLMIDDEAGLRQFARFLDNIAFERKQVFDRADAENFGDYRKKGHVMPAVAVLIDNYFALSETYPDVDERLANSVRDGFKYGIYFAVTSANSYGVRYKFTVNFKMAATFQLIDKTEYSSVVGRTEGLEPDNYRGRMLIRAERPMEAHAALPEFAEGGGDDRKIISTKDIIDSLAENEKRRAVPIPIMPEKVDFDKLNAASAKMAIGISDVTLESVALELSDYASFVITGDAGSGKSTIATLWLSHLKNARIYAKDSDSLGFIKLMNNENVTDISDDEDFSELIDEMNELIESRKNELAEAKRGGKDVYPITQKWAHIVFAFDAFADFAENGDYDDLKDLLTRVVKKERGLKITVLAVGNHEELGGSYEDIAKAVKKEQAGILLGSIKEQNYFDASLPYSTPEKNIAFGDGYLINRTKFVGIRAAFRY